MRVAAVTYSGNWRRDRYQQQEMLLRAGMVELGLTACGHPKFARHNPSFWPTFLRKNEILIPLCD